MGSLSKYEQETVINFNAGEKLEPKNDMTKDFDITIKPIQAGIETDTIKSKPAFSILLNSYLSLSNK